MLAELCPLPVHYSFCLCYITRDSLKVVICAKYINLNKNHKNLTYVPEI